MTVAYDPAKQYEIKVWDIAYRHDPVRTLMARIDQPQGAGPFPALLDVHGGAWNAGPHGQCARGQAPGGQRYPGGD
jgi:hypothetical protein